MKLTPTVTTQNESLYTLDSQATLDNFDWDDGEGDDVLLPLPGSNSRGPGGLPFQLYVNNQIPSDEHYVMVTEDTVYRASLLE